MLLSKYIATGNSFVAIDNRQEIFPLSQITPLCEQYECDGLLLLQNSKEYDFTMRYYNRDGSHADMCGNGGRAITIFASHLDIKPRQGSVYTFETSKSRYQSQILLDDQVKLLMSELYDQDTIDLSQFGYSNHFYLNTGVPHVVLEVEDIDNFDVVDKGRAIAHNELFSEGANVNFFQRLSDNRLRLRTYERGVEDETLSCGTGATATAIAASGFFGWKNFVDLEVKGGELQVLFNGDFSEIYLCGKVEKILSKSVELPLN